MELDEGEALFLESFFRLEPFRLWTLDEIQKIKYPWSWYDSVRDARYFWPEVKEAYHGTNAR